MPALLESASDVRARVLVHLLTRVRATPLCAEPFAHTYFEDVFPADVYAALLAHLPPAARYSRGVNEPNGRHEVRAFYHLTADGVRRLPEGARDLWRGVAAALTSADLKRAVYARFAVELELRFRVPHAEVPGFARPTLYREVSGYELRPHPDTPKKVVTMHLYLPADDTQLHLGTALYVCAPDATFTKVKQFVFRPNSGYAFAVNDRGPRASWHGRELLPADAGVRHTLLNTFYADPRPGFRAYLDSETVDAN